MSRGKRYNGSEHKLNIKKVIAVIIAFFSNNNVCSSFYKINAAKGRNN